MPKFIYQVRDARGGTVNGALNAPSETDASRVLRAEGHIIISLHEQQGAAQASGQAHRPPTRAKPDDVIFFANQLAVMVDTGVPLADALDSIAEQAEAESFRFICSDISEQVKAGMDFSAALTRYPKVFSRLFVAMVKASEATGTMGKMLQRVSNYLEQQRQVRKRVKGAMAYPLAMLGFCVAVVVAMLVFILPRFEKIYSGKSAALPLPTRFLLALSNGIVTYWPFLIAAVALAVTGAVLFVRRPDGKIMLDQVRIRMPLLGGMFRRACLARSLRTLSTMVATGVSMLDCLEIAAEVSGNVRFDAIWRELREKLKEGASLSEEMYKYELIPPCVTQMVAAGERTGKLAPVLDRVSTFCEEDLNAAIRTATSFIEPVMIVVMGLIVGGIAMALLLPVFSLSRVVAQ